MKQKTAMQQLFENIQTEQLNLIDAWEWLINNKDHLLQTERQQIEGAYKAAINDAFRIPNSFDGCETKYFNQTFGE